MHTLILTADDYVILQQVFATHFQKTERYLERLTDALIFYSDSVADIAPSQQRSHIQTTAPEYLFHKRGIAWDKAFLDGIRHTLKVQRTMPITTIDFYHLVNLVVAALPTLAPKITPLYCKIADLASQPIGNDEKIVLVLRVGFSESL